MGYFVLMLGLRKGRQEMLVKGAIKIDERKPR